MSSASVVVRVELGASESIRRFCVCVCGGGELSKGSHARVLRLPKLKTPGFNPLFFGMGSKFTFEKKCSTSGQHTVSARFWDFEKKILQF